MHVLILPSWYPENSGDIGGSFFREQALAIQKHDYKVGVIFPQLRSLKNWKSILSGNYGLSIQLDDGMPTYRYTGMNWFPRMAVPNSWLFIRAGIIAYRQYVLDHGKPDIIHVHSALYAGCLALKIKELYNIPYVITEHFSAYPRGLISKSGISLTQKVTASASRKFAVSHSFAKDMALILDEDPDSWEELPNIVHERFLSKSLSHISCVDSFSLICVASLTENKGIHNIIEAFSIAFSEIPLVFLKIGGDGPARSELEQLVIKYNMSERIYFLGALSRDEVQLQISNCDILVVASTYETFSVVIVEALALGKPVISTRCGGPESIVREQDGILVPNGDVSALAQGMLQIWSKPAIYDPIVIRQGCIDRYSDDAVVGRLKRVYQQVLLTSGN